MEHLSKKEWGRILREMRRLWSRSEIRRQALKASTEYWYPPKKDGSPGKAKRIKGYWCADCEELLEKTQVQVDHITPVKDGDRRLDQLCLLWCDVNSLQVLCRNCHVRKTNKERKK